MHVCVIGKQYAVPVGSLHKNVAKGGNSFTRRRWTHQSTSTGHRSGLSTFRTRPQAKANPRITGITVFFIVCKDTKPSFETVAFDVETFFMAPIL